MNDAMSATISEYTEFFENYISENCFCYDNEPQQKLFQSMRYSLLAGGKRLRPIFLFDFCRMCGGDWKNAVTFAAAIEMIHTYSLIHDDLPCMDNDDFRRGVPTNHRVFGEAVAVLAGDALLTAAFSFLAKATYTPECRIKAVEILSECSGELGMVGGQLLDIESEHRLCTEQEVLDIQSRKTGALIRASCLLGVLAGGGDQEQIKAAATFASNLGLAFQIRDDVLDVIGDAKELGKNTGMDGDKNTFVRLYGIEKCNKLIQEYTDNAKKALSAFKDSGFMSQLAETLTTRTV